MKKINIKMSLSKETLRDLDLKAVSGARTAACTAICSVTGCGGTCP